MNVISVIKVRRGNTTNILALPLSILCAIIKYLINIIDSNVINIVQHEKAHLPPST
jgi:hypothetical protein